MSATTLWSEPLTNAEIGLPYVHQPRSANYHLHNVFTKLGITSREHLNRVLDRRLSPATPLLGTTRGGARAGTTASLMRITP